MSSGVGMLFAKVQDPAACMRPERVKTMTRLRKRRSEVDGVSDELGEFSEDEGDAGASPLATDTRPNLKI